jgi:hypothetical protein
MAVLSGSRFTPDLATSDRLLLACRHAARAVRCTGIDRQRACVRSMRGKRQPQRRPLPHQSHADGATAMPPPLGACGTFAPTLPIHLVCGHLGHLAPDTPPRRPTAHDLGALWLPGVSPGLPLRPPRDPWRLPLCLCGLGARLQEARHGSPVLDRASHWRPGRPGHLPAAGPPTGPTLPQRLCTPPVGAARWPSSAARPACHAALRRQPGG